MQTVRRPPLIGSGIANASGVCEILFRPDSKNAARLLERINIASDSTLTPEVFVYVGSNTSDENFVDYTPAGKRDVSVNEPAIWVPGSTPILVRFTGCTVGARCTVHIQNQIELQN